MQHANGERHAVILFFAGNSPNWLRDITSYLGKLDYQIYEANNADDLWHLVDTHPIDALLAANHPKSLTIFKAVRKKLSPDRQPLLTLIYDQAPNDLSEIPADMVGTAASPSILEHQLRTSIDMRREQVKLRQVNHELQKELQAQKHNTNGIELLKNAIVWNVAHELRTPLLQVKSAIALLAEDAGDIATLIVLAQRATTRLETQIQNITLLNELINENPERRNFEAVPVKEIVDSAILNLRRTWEHRGNVERISQRIPKKSTTRIR